jgi:hypothetical protein
MTITAGTAPTRRVTIQGLDQRGKPAPKKYPLIEAQFNPTSLQYTINNTAAQGSGKGKTRAVDESTGKLTMDLVFDTTHSGEDVRSKTQPIALLMKPAGAKLTPIVEVRWGDFKFKGALDSYRETIDFFSPEGRPLRASLSLGFSTVTHKNRTPPEVFAFASNGKAIDLGGGFQATNSAFTYDRPTLQGTAPTGDHRYTYEVPVFRGVSTTAAATAMDDPEAGNELAAQNAIEDPRNGSDAGDTMLVSDQPVLEEPLDFAPSGGGGGGIGAEGGVGAGAGFGAGAGAGVGASAGAGLGLGAGGFAGASFGAGASAGGFAGASFGASAGAGAFAGASAGGFAGASFSAGASAGGFAGASAGGFAGASAGGFAGASAGGFAGASFSASAGASGFASASASGFASASFSASADASASASFSSSAGARTGSAASAGVSASAGAFAGLRPARAPAPARFDVSMIFEALPVPAPVVDDPLGFGPGGVALRSGGDTVDVGQRVSLRDLIEFDEE